MENGKWKMENYGRAASGRAGWNNFKSAIFNSLNRRAACAAWGRAAAIFNFQFSIFNSNSTAACPLRGQAAVEFVIAIIALLLIVSGGMLLFDLNKTRRDMAVEMRAEAGMAALRGSRAETLDQSLIVAIVNHAAMKESANWNRVQNLLQQYAPDSKRAEPFFALSSLEFVRESQSGDVRVEKVIQHFLIPKETITVTHEVCLPASSGLY